MGRNSKFSFPLPGKRSHPGQDPSARDEQQLSKAEKILGTSGLAVSSSSNTSRLSKLRSRPSYQALQVPVTSAGEYSDSNDMHSSYRDEHQAAQPRYATMRRQASSDVLGSVQNGDSGTQSSVSSSSRTWALRNYNSSSTLKSFYDPEKQPLPISQQTSESAIRDMALRKGKPLVVGKRPSIGHGGHEETERIRTGGTDSKGTTKRPPRLDLSRLFQRPSTSSLNVVSPDPLLVVGSPTAISHTSEYFARQPSHFRSSATNSVKSPMAPHSTYGLKSPTKSTSSSGMKSPLLRSGSKLLKGRPSTSGSLKAAYQNRHVGNERLDVKQHVHRPPQGAKNWFDGLLEEEDEFDEEMETEASTPTTGILSYRDHELETQTEEEYIPVEDHFNPPVKHHFNPPEPAPSFTIHRGISHRESRRELDCNSSRPSTLKSPRTPVSPMSLVPPVCSMSPVSPRSSRTRSSRQRQSVLANSDLGDTSILSLSSSSDEDSEDGDSLNSRLPKFRNSIKVSDIDTIVIGEAHAFRVSANNKASNITEHAVQKRRTSIASTGSILSTSTAAETSSLHSSKAGSTYLVVPPRGDRPRRSGHTRQPSSIPEDRDKPSTTTATTSPISPPTSNRSSMPGDAESVKSEPRKMMAVTDEEEALLEMMRSKRAAMAKNSLSNQSRTTMKSISSLASSSSRSTHANRPLSTSSSILDSFPISRSQRSSLMVANVNSNSQPDLLNAVAASAGTIPRQRSGSTQSRATQQSKRTSTTSSISSRLERSYPAYPPHLTLAPLDVSLSPIPSPVYSQAPNDARSPSPEPFSSPSTPQTRRGSADIMIRPTPSQRTSLASFGHHVNAMEHTHTLAEEEIHGDQSFNKETHRHSRRRTASSNANMLIDSESEEERGSKGDSVDPALMRKEIRLSSGQMQRPNIPTVCATTMAQAENLGYVWERNGDKVGLRLARAVVDNAVSARCSVSEDVLAAWGSLGGWRDVSI
jgi:hypothetical protein